MLRQRGFTWRMRVVTLALMVLVPLQITTQAAMAAPECANSAVHIVQSGETVSGIAQQYGVTEAAIVQRNGLANPNMIYAGQRLVIPTCGGAAMPSTGSGTAQMIHVVQSGETLSGIALRYGVTEAGIAQRNGLANPNAIYAGQRLIIPAGGSVPTVVPPAATNTAMPSGAADAKRIEINLSTQMLYAYEGARLVLSSGVSTGRPGWETPTGNFEIYAKNPVQTLSGSVNGEAWYVPNVPHVMYIYLGIALHGAYWHNSFGTGERLSHGCVNQPLDVAAQLYAWAPLGTPVWVHS